MIQRFGNFVHDTVSNVAEFITTTTSSKNNKANSKNNKPKINTN